jgi:phage FluMu protein gp41
VSDARAEALLKSALEKIVYFEARSGQLEGDAAAARAEVSRLKAELGSASVREVELRQKLAELEATLASTHRDREELGRVVEMLRAERTSLVEKLLDASRIRGVLSDEDGSFDLAAFISQLRSEVLAARAASDADEPEPVTPAPLPLDSDFEDVPIDDAVAFQAEVARQMAKGVWGESSDAPRGPPRPSASPPVALASPPAPASAVPPAAEREGLSERAVLQQEADAAIGGWAPAAAHVRAAREVSEATGLALGFEAQGRLNGPRPGTLPPRRRPPGDGTLYGFSVRELSAPDAAARVRAAERLGALGDRQAASAVASALHAERDPLAAVAFLEALRRLAGPEGAQVVEPFVDAPVPEVRIAALRTLLTLDARRAIPQLERAARDPDASVRRRATLLSLQLPREEGKAMAPAAAADADPEVRRVAALAAGASGGQEARTALLLALDDASQPVRKAAARSLSRLLGVEVDAVASLEGPQRRREIRRLTSLPTASLKARASSALAREGTRVRAEARRTEVAVVEVTEVTEVTEAKAGPSPEALCAPVLSELKAAMRGCSLPELIETLGVPAQTVEVACALLTARGQVVRRGTKLFVA